jgi:hypothetical protein
MWFSAIADERDARIAKSLNSEQHRQAAKLARQRLGDAAGQ